MSKFIDLTGRRFGRWKVIERGRDYISKQGIHQTRWVCECSCDKHTIREVNSSSLIQGSSLSCGCVNVEKLIQRNKINKWSSKQVNNYEIIEDYAKGYDDNGRYFIIDIEDIPKCRQYRWFYERYWYTTIKNKKISLHHFILSVEEEIIIDHADRDRNNNRKYNLRTCTSQENSINRSLASNNKTGIMGLWFDKGRKSWEVKISVNGVSKRIGRFKNKEEAIKARLLGEKEYYGEFAPQRHLFKEYGI